jgi:paraquat-inducible protein B
MRDKSALVGAFILGAMGLAVAGLLFFGGTRLFSKSLHAVAFFSESVAGLEVGAPVTFHGVRIGLVKNVAIEFSTTSMTARIPVVLEIQPELITWEGGKQLAERPEDFQRLLKSGLRAQLEMQSFVTGQLRVDLELKPEEPARLTGVATGMPEIPTTPSDLGQFFAQLKGLKLQDLAQSAQEAFTSASGFLRHLDSLLDPLAGNANGALIAAEKTFRTGDDAIASLKTEALIALKDLDGLLVDARRQLGPRGAELSHTLTSADRAARQVATLFESLNGLAQPRAPFRGNLEAAMRDLAGAVGSLRDFATTIERNPNALLLGRTSR